MSGGLSLGYPTTGGTWIAMRYSAEHGRKLPAIGTADGILDADGKTVFAFDQAQARARDWLAKQVKQESGEVAEDRGLTRSPRRWRNKPRPFQHCGGRVAIRRRGPAHLAQDTPVVSTADILQPQLRG